MKPRRKKKSKGFPTGWVILGVLGAFFCIITIAGGGIAAFLLTRDKSIQNDPKKVVEKTPFDDLFATSNFTQPKKPAKTRPIKKVILVDETGRALDPMNSLLPAELAAKTLEELDAVVVLKRDHRVDGLWVPAHLKNQPGAQGIPRKQGLIVMTFVTKSGFLLRENMENWVNGPVPPVSIPDYRNPPKVEYPTSDQVNQFLRVAAQNVPPFYELDVPVVEPDDPMFKTLARPAKGKSAETYLKLVSSRGDPMGHGATYHYPQHALNVFKMDGAYNLNAHGWDIGFSAKPDLKVGAYKSPKEAKSLQGKLGIRAPGSFGKDLPEHYFQVWEIESKGNSITRLAIDFIVRETATAPPLLGKLRVNSNFE